MNRSIWTVAFLFIVVAGSASAQCNWVSSGSSLNTTCGTGIGTTSPAAFFHVNGSLWQFMLVQRGTKALYVNANWSGTNSWAQIAPRQADNMGLSLSSNDNAPEYLFVATGGNVGVGTTTPTQKLHVEGNIHVSGNINAKYQDVAEWVPASSDLAAGTVVVLNPARDNEVMASSRSYDTSVAGVVSAQPGLTLGEKSDSKEAIATMGRVLVRVDARKAPIAVGDLLVTSDQQGFAMKSVPVDVSGIAMHRPGTIIGKALQPLAEGTGEILVLLSLQ